MRVRLKNLIAPCFWEVHRAIRRGEVQEVVAKGGRGSGKSSYISLELVVQLLRHPDCHAIVLRKVGGTMRTSVYAQVRWAIGALGLNRKFRCTVSPMECTYLPTGQKILFFGADDPGKLKRVKVPFRAIGKMAGGMVSQEMCEGIVTIVNGHAIAFFKGLGKVIGGFFRQQKVIKKANEMK